MNTKQMKYQEKFGKELPGHVSPETAVTVDNYPWGFRLKTQKRYWVESKKGFGQRVVSQTLNPKTGKWCKPKASTYYVVIGLYEAKNGYIDWTALSSGGWSKEEDIKEFESYFPTLTDFQRNQIRYIRATNVANSVIKVEIKATSFGIPLSKLTNPGSKDAKDAIDAGIKRQEDVKKNNDLVLRKALAYGFGVVDGKIKEGN